jgi:adenosylcobyric acid synthase
VVVDCLSLWVANLLELGREPDLRVPARPGPTIAVSNEVGLGIVPANPLARSYRDQLGRVNAAWAEAAEASFLVVAGKALELADV